jgi:predicted acylesterase/phospholipase RssA
MSKKKIKSIVMSGGGNVAFTFYGVLRESHSSGIWNFDDVEAYYSTSAGSIVAAMMPVAKHLGWEIMDDFMLKRPWQKLFEFSLTTIVAAYQKQGMFDETIAKKIYEPLLLAADLSIDITLAEHHAWCGKDMHFIACDLTNMEIVDLNWRTHPDWRLTDAVYCSMCLPMLCVPYKCDGHIYADGGVMCNFPVHQCLADGWDENEILGIDATKYDVSSNTQEFDTITDYLLWLLVCAWRKISAPRRQIPYHLHIKKEKEYASIYDIYVSTSSLEERTKLVENGKQLARDFYETTWNIQDAEI